MNRINAAMLQNKLQSRLDDDIESGRVGCAELLVWQDNTPVAQVTSGLSDIDRHIAAVPGNLYRLASMTKPVTATAILICAERGLLSLNDKVSDYLPDFGKKRLAVTDGKGGFMPGEPVSDKLCIWHLLSHTAGIGTGDYGNAALQAMTPEQRKDLKSAVDWYGNNLLFDFVPESQEAYSPLAGMDVAARIAELVSGLPFNEFIYRNIFSPLGLHDITFTPSDGQWVRMVKMHNRKQDGTGCTDGRLAHSIFEELPPTYYGAGACLAGTASDYLTFALMLQNGGTYNGVRVLTEESVHQMRTARLIFRKRENWGLGVRVMLDDPYLPAGSFGWSGAYGSHFWVDTVNRITAVYMKNSYYDGGAGCVTSKHFEEDVYTSLEEN